MFKSERFHKGPKLQDRWIENRFFLINNIFLRSDLLANDSNEFSDQL